MFIKLSKEKILAGLAAGLLVLCRRSQLIFLSQKAINATQNRKISGFHGCLSFAQSVKIIAKA